MDARLDVCDISRGVLRASEGLRTPCSPQCCENRVTEGFRDLKEGPLEQKIHSCRLPDDMSIRAIPLFLKATETWELISSKADDSCHSMGHMRELLTEGPCALRLKAPGCSSLIPRMQKRTALQTCSPSCPWSLRLAPPPSHGDALH